MFQIAKRVKPSCERVQKFYIVCFEGDNHGMLRLVGVEPAMRLDQLLGHSWLKKATSIAIDGPCAANGIRLNSRRTGFDYPAPGVRNAEHILAGMGIKLFWTTQNTLTNFDGASRWIARSLVLFADFADQGLGDRVFEVHPHAVFTILQRAFHPGQPLATKARGPGRKQRLDLLRMFVPELSADHLPNHDAVDSAAAALMGALREAGKARRVGEEAGGYIWIPSL